MNQRAKRSVVIALGSASTLLTACSLLFPYDDFSSPSDAGVDATSDVDGGCVAPFLQCGSLCLDPRNDPAHCGACDIVCKNTTCGGAMCKPYAGASAGVVPAGIVFDGTFVYWAVAKSVTEASYVYRLNPLDVASGVDGSTPQLRSLGAVTVTHVVQASSGDLIYSLENRIAAADAGPQPAQVRYFRFDVDAGAKLLSLTPPGDTVSGIAVREVDAGTNLVWVSETPDGGTGAVTLHLGSMVGGVGAEVDAGAVSFVYNGTTALPHVDPLAAGPDPQLFFFASDVAAANWVLERLDHGLEGNWSSANSKVLANKPVRGLAYDGTYLIWTVDNEIWQSTPSAMSASKLGSVGSNGDIAYAISGDKDDTYVLSAPPTDRTKGKLWRRRRNGGAITAVGTATIDGDGAVLVTDAWVFWVSAGELRFFAR